MTNKPRYIAVLENAIKILHSCGPDYLRTEHVHEEFHGETVWDGDVQVFHLTDHPRAVQAYAWANPVGPNNEKTIYFVVLGKPPITDARTAIQAVIMAATKRSD